MGADDTPLQNRSSHRSGEYDDTSEWRSNVNRKLDKIVEMMGAGTTAIELLKLQVVNLQKWQDTADTDSRSTALGIKLCVITSIVGPSIAILFTIFHK